MTRSSPPASLSQILATTTANEIGGAPGRRLLRVRAGDRWYGCALEDVHEIVALRPLTRLPGAPPHVPGLMNLRGLLVTVVDLAARVGSAPTAEAEGRPVAGVVLLVPKGDGRLAGCLVTSVRDVIPWPEEVTELSSPGGNANGARIVCGMTDHRGESLLLVDLRALVDDALR